MMDKTELLEIKRGEPPGKNMRPFRKIWEILCMNGWIPERLMFLGVEGSARAQEHKEALSWHCSSIHWLACHLNLWGEMTNISCWKHQVLGGGFKYFLCLPLPGEMIPID